jgi:hypothetical protein
MVYSCLVAGMSPEKAIKCGIISGPELNVAGVSCGKGTLDNMALPETEDLMFC